MITTTGDRIQDRRLLEIGGKALFTKEIEEALLDGRIDCAVHSLKDVPAELPAGLCIAAIPEREDPRDAFVSRDFDGFDDLPQGARLGTASLRRQAQALHLRPDLQIEMLRGNVDTRLRQAGRRASPTPSCWPPPGLNRLGLGRRMPRACSIPSTPRRPRARAPWHRRPAPTTPTPPGSRALRHAPDRLCVAAERGALEALEGSCRTAIGAHARLEGGRLRLIVEALTPDGRAALPPRGAGVVR